MSLEQFEDNFRFPSNEEEILKFWLENDIYGKIVMKNEGSKVFRMIDGPPFCSGTLHSGHCLVSYAKSCVLNYMQMQGYSVTNKLGYDTHGLPIELNVNKLLDINTKKDVEKLGIDKYNDKCKETVHSYGGQWHPTFDRLGRFLDYKNEYKTMDTNFMESCWWVFKQLWDKRLIQRGYKIMPFSTKCGTSLSNFEASGDDVYKLTQNPSVYVKFELKNIPNTFFLVWTTTPWTLPCNLALCMNATVKYVKVQDKVTNNIYIIAEECLGNVYKLKKGDTYDKYYEVLSHHLGLEFLNMLYIPPFNYFPNREYKVICEDYVKVDSGTGIVHTAPGFGEDDFNACIKNNIVKLEEIGQYCPVDDDGKYTLPIKDYLGIHVHEANNIIIEKLKQDKLLVKKEMYSHKYPFCWRTDTPLIYKAVSSYYIDVPAIKDQLLENNKKINWVPSHIGTNKMQRWLENVKPWNISRSRFFGTPLPIWMSDDGEEVVCVGSIDELVKLANLTTRPTDIHREFVDNITIPSQQGKGVLRRIPEILDCWFESGSVPYGQIHYPFENPNEFDNKEYLCDFVCEGVEQTSHWFYTLNVLSTALFNKPAFKTAVCTGMILAEDGKKMSKRLSNYVNPMDVIKQYGSDACRIYLMHSPASRAEFFRFKMDDISQLSKPHVQLLNCAKFFIEHTTKFTKDGNKFSSSAYETSSNVMDKWIQSRLETCLNSINNNMKQYKINKVVNEINDFIEELTNWYIKFNRNRLRGRFTDTMDQTSALSTLYYTLINFTKIIAPFMPFLSESIYQKLKVLLPIKQQYESVHMCYYPHISTIGEKMKKLQSVCKIVRSIRSKPSSVNISSVKIPLKSITVSSDINTLEDIKQLERYLREEINVMNVYYDTNISNFVKYTVTPNNKTLGLKYKSMAKLIKKELDNLSQEQLSNFTTSNSLGLTVNNQSIILTDEDINIERVLVNSAVNNTVMDIMDDIVVTVDLTQDDEVMNYYMKRLFIVAIQDMRKKTKLKPWNKINIYYETSSDKLKSTVNHYYDNIVEELLYPVINRPPNTKLKIITTKETNIIDEPIKITITEQV